MTDLFGTVNSSAVISDCGQYRYSLTRCWDISLPRLLWILLNPSVADANRDDPTLRRCKGLAKQWGYGSLEVVNLFAIRGTDPRILKQVKDPIGPGNDEVIMASVARASRVVVAWGAHGLYLDRDFAVLNMIGPCFCLNKTRGGLPGHPLYVSNKCKPLPYENWSERW